MKRLGTQACYLALAVFVIASAMILPTRTQASELRLLMFEQRACIWCEAWNKQIAEAYPNSWEGRLAPLQRINIHSGDRTDWEVIAWPRHTPTFVLVRGNREVGRITGYPGEDFFWPMLDEILQKAGEKEPSG
jgi:thioredoxin-related protein